MKNGDYVIRERGTIRRLFTKKKVYKVILSTIEYIYLRDFKGRLHYTSADNVKPATIREIREYFK